MHDERNVSSGRMGERIDEYLYDGSRRENPTGGNWKGWQTGKRLCFYAVWGHDCSVHGDCIQEAERWN